MMNKSFLKNPDATLSWDHVLLISGEKTVLGRGKYRFPEGEIFFPHSQEIPTLRESRSRIPPTWPASQIWLHIQRYRFRPVPKTILRCWANSDRPWLLLPTLRGRGGSC